MKLPIESVRSIANRSFMMGGALGEVALRTAYVAGRSGYFVTQNIVKLALSPMLPNNPYSGAPYADTSNVVELPITSVPSDSEPMAESVDPVIEQTIALGPIALFLTANPDSNDQL